MKLLLKILVSLVTLGLLLWLIPWSDMRQAFRRMDGGVWLWVLGVAVLGHLLGVFKWRRLVSSGRSSIRAVDALRCYAAGLFANLCLPSVVGGDVLRAVLATRVCRRRESIVLGSIADRALDLTALAVLMTIGALAAGRHAGGVAAVLVTWSFLLGVPLLGAIVWWAMRRPLREWSPRHRRSAGRALVALRRLRRRPSLAALTLSISLFVQGSFVLLNAWIGLVMGIEVPVLAWFLVWPLAKVAGLLPISLGGLGVRDGTFAGLLVPLGVAPALGFVVSLIWQTILVSLGLLGGLTWALLGSPRRDEREPLLAAPVAGLELDERPLGAD